MAGFLKQSLETRSNLRHRPSGGEAQQLTKSETSIGNLPGRRRQTIAYTATEPTSQPLKDRKDYYGDYDVVREG